MYIVGSIDWLIGFAIVSEIDRRNHIGEILLIFRIENNWVLIVGCIGHVIHMIYMRACRHIVYLDI